MNSSFLLILNKRIKVGKRYNNKLRTDGKIPAIVYRNSLSTPVYFDKINLNFLSKIIASGFELIKCKLDEDIFTVFIKDIYRHPTKLNIIHLDFQRVKETDIITSKILLKFANEKESPGIKQGGFLIRHMSCINVKACVANAPKYIDIDLSNLTFNNPIFLSDVKLPNETRLSTLYKNASELLVASAVVSRTGLKKEEKTD